MKKPMTVKKHDKSWNDWINAYTAWTKKNVGEQININTLTPDGKRLGAWVAAVCNGVHNRKNSRNISEPRREQLIKIGFPSDLRRERTDKRLAECRFAVETGNIKAIKDLFNDPIFRKAGIWLSHVKVHMMTYPCNEHTLRALIDMGFADEILGNKRVFNMYINRVDLLLDQGLTIDDILSSGQTRVRSVAAWIRFIRETFHSSVFCTDEFRSRLIRQGVLS